MNFRLTSRDMDRPAAPAQVCDPMAEGEGAVRIVARHLEEVDDDRFGFDRIQCFDSLA